MSHIPITRLQDPEEKQVERLGCSISGEVCEVVPAQLVQKVAEYRIFADDFLTNIVTCDVAGATEVTVEDVCALRRTVEFDPRAIFNKVFDCGSIKISGTVKVTFDGGDTIECPFHVRAVFQEIEPLEGVRPTDQVKEQLEFIDGAEVCVVDTTDPETGDETQMLIFKASLIVEKRIFRCVIEGVPECPPVGPTVAPTPGAGEITL